MVGIAGPAGAGKSEAARALVEYYGYRAIGFADPIRATVLALYPHWGPAHLEDRALKDAVDPEYGTSPRQALEIVGDHGRRIDPSGYVRLAQERVLRAAREAKERGEGRARVVFFDVRKSEEARWIRAWGGTMAFVERPGVGYALTHATSSPVTRLAADVVIRNDGDLDDLRGRIGAVFGG